MSRIFRTEKGKCLITNRTGIYYMLYGQFNIEDLNGKNILDIGSGMSDFSKFAKKHKAKVFSLDCEDIDKLYIHDKHTKGQAEHLPFKDNSFDMITMLFSIPMYVDLPQNKIQLYYIFYEILRVLKKGGTIRFAPAKCNGFHPESYQYLRHIIYHFIISRKK